MKATTLKSLLVTLVLFICTIQGYSQQIAGTLITVKGNNYSYSDQMWVFTVSTCTRNFDNGWDGYKMLGTSMAPQIYAEEAAGNFQVDAVPDANNTYISFTAGVDTTYTMTFTNDNLVAYYQKMYLIDSVANKTIDIYSTGTTYTFTATNTVPMKRFKMATSLPIIVTPPPVTVTPPVVTTPPVVIPPVSTVDPGATANKGKDAKDKKDKKIKIYNSGKTITVENPGKKGKLKICHAVTGRVLKNVDINSSSTTNIQSDLPSGTYIVNGTNDDDDVSTVVIIR